LRDAKPRAIQKRMLDEVGNPDKRHYQRYRTVVTSSERGLEKLMERSVRREVWDFFDRGGKVEDIEKYAATLPSSMMLTDDNEASKSSEVISIPTVAQFICMFCILRTGGHATTSVKLTMSLTASTLNIPTSGIDAIMSVYTITPWIALLATDSLYWLP